ncbi:hypothetical protein Ddc_09651 [Ditylenchus destructor]|nr:hypothetical protein Ddc_09651 [Ditylenchus destructor]
MDMEIVDYLLNTQVNSLLFDQPDGEHTGIWVVGRAAAIYTVHRIARQLVSEDDTYVLTYPTIRLFDILIRKRRMYGWKKESQAFVKVTIIFFLVELLLKLTYAAMLTSLSNQMSATAFSEMLWWLIFAVCCTPLVWHILDHPLMNHANDEGNEGESVQMVNIKGVRFCFIVTWIISTFFLFMLFNPVHDVHYLSVYVIVHFCALLATILYHTVFALLYLRRYPIREIARRHSAILIVVLILVIQFATAIGGLIMSCNLYSSDTNKCPVEQFGCVLFAGIFVIATFMGLMKGAKISTCVHEQQFLNVERPISSRKLVFCFLLNPNYANAYENLHAIEN